MEFRVKSNKVLILASVASMIEQFNMNNLEILQKRGLEVHVACNFKDGSTIPNSKVVLFQKKLHDMNITIHQIDFDRNATNIKKFILAYKQTLKLFQSQNYDFVHCHSPVGGACARLAGKRTKTEIIYTAHGFHFFKGAPISNWLIFYPVEKYLSRYTSKLITINEEDYYLSSRKFKSSSIQYVPGVGVDSNKFIPVSKLNKKELRIKLSIDPNLFTLVYVGELSDRKNQMFLLESLIKLKTQISNFKVYLVGVGPNESKYIEYIKDNNLAPFVELMGYRSDIPEIMASADIVISTSRQEGLPVNVMEAMSTGIPLIVTNCRGNVDLVRDGINGFVVQLDDVDQLVDKIKYLWSCEETRQNFSKASLEEVEKYSMKNVSKLMFEIYSEYID